MKICAKEARRWKSKIEFRILMEKIKRRTVFGLPGAVRSLRNFEEVVVDLVEEFASLGKALKCKIYYFIGFSAQTLTLGIFFYLNEYASGLGSTNLSTILRFTFSGETDF